jgi:hypothetical protein
MLLLQNQFTFSVFFFLRGTRPVSINYYSVSSERLDDIKITKFYVEKVVPSARKI